MCFSLTFKEQPSKSFIWQLGVYVRFFSSEGPEVQFLFPDSERTAGDSLVSHSFSCSSQNDKCQKEKWCGVCFFFFSFCFSVFTTLVSGIFDSP